MGLDKLVTTLDSFYDSIVVELGARRIIPTLILFHSALDTVGWLGSSERYATRNSFCVWVDRYLFTSGDFDCSAIDLYASRCGLLHTASPDSKLAVEGKAKRICWAWGEADIKDMRNGIALTGGEGNLVAVHLEDLIEAWRIGVTKFLAETHGDQDLEATVLSKASQFFGALSIDIMKRASEIYETTRAEDGDQGENETECEV